VRGASIDWAGFHRDEKHRRVALPTYPFQRKRYWVEQPAQSQSLSQDKSPILNLIVQGETAQLAQRLAKTGRLSTEQQKL
jgi:acyl transferase domain-containing protein